MTEKRNYGLIAFILVCIFWGSTYLAIRIGVMDFPPLLFGAFRFLIAGASILIYALFKKLEFPTSWSDVLKVSATGLLLLVGGTGVLVIAETRIDSGIAALIIAIVPLFMALIELIVPSDYRISPIGWIGLVLGFLGVAYLGFPSNDKLNVDMLGLILSIAAAFSWSLGSVYSKRIKPSGSIITHLGIEMLSGGIALFFMGLLKDEFSYLHPTLRGIGALLYLVIFGSLVGYSAYIYLLKVWPISKAGTYAYINPIVAVLLGWLILGEKLTSKVIISAFIILFGVLLVQKSKVEKIQN